MKLFVIFLISWLGFNVLAQDSIQLENPYFSSQENVFDELVNPPSITNPLLLNGRIKNVVKTTSSYAEDTINADIRETIEYTFDANKTLINYASDIEFDETTTEKVNASKEFYVYNDTTVTLKGLTYTILNKKIIAIESKENYAGVYDFFVDSIAYGYQDDKLKTIKHYQKDVLDNIDNKGNFTGEGYLSEYILNSMEIGTYNNQDLLHSITSVANLLESIYSSISYYNYNRDGLLECFKRTVNSYDTDEYDLEEIFNAKEIKLPATIEEKYREGVMEYVDDTLVSFKTRIKSGNEKEKIEEKLTYFQDIITSESYINNQLIERQTITFDKYSNPILIKNYELKEHQPILKSVTKLNIDYFE